MSQQNDTTKENIKYKVYKIKSSGSLFVSWYRCIGESKIKCDNNAVRGVQII